ncbi:acireductone dioxygenase 2-like [Diospyros lotus]|uniref:acireductone dioxygenase 2-like n=1 Tax=Diospyros lotus TaxID=55363 RepID=UPI002252C37E|nr:acireductone dioxygenase 2-like [Diospyros lotus]
MASATKESAIQAWYIDDNTEDYRLPHHVNPPKYVTPEELRELGVLNWTLDADNYENDEEYKKVYAAQGYTYSDIVEVSPEVLPNYEETLKSWFEERTGHEDKTRFCIAGSGYFDVKDREGKWIRIWQKKGGLIVMTAGVTHRYTLDTDNYHKVIRLFDKKP